LHFTFVREIESFSQSVAEVKGSPKRGSPKRGSPKGGPLRGGIALKQKRLHILKRFAAKPRQKRGWIFHKSG